MKKIFLFLMSATFACTGFAETCVSIKQVSTDYSLRRVTFNLTWGTCSEEPNTRIWVFVDYRKVNENGSKDPAWKRAVLSGQSSGTLDAMDKGLWITTGSTTTVAVTLLTGENETMPEKFDWCAFASDSPPNATWANGTFTLKGTPPFYINGNATPHTATTYVGDCITSISDATLNPAGTAINPTATITGVPGINVGNSTQWTGSPAGAVMTWSRSGSNANAASLTSGTETNEVTIYGSVIGMPLISYNVVHEAGCTWNASRRIIVGWTGSGAITSVTGCNASAFSLGTVGFWDNTQWRISGNGISQTWSSPVVATGCEKDTYGATNSTSDCIRSTNLEGGDLFSFCLASTHRNALCPSPWRMPTISDFQNLDKGLGGTGVSRSIDNPNDALFAKYFGTTTLPGQNFGCKSNCVVTSPSAITPNCQALGEVCGMCTLWSRDSNSSTWPGSLLYVRPGGSCCSGCGFIYRNTTESGQAFYQSRTGRAVRCVR